MTNGIRTLIVSCLLALLCRSGHAEAFRFPEATHGKGRLRYEVGIPIVTLEGTPQEIGEQMGMLVLKPARGLLDQADELLSAHGLERVFPLMQKVGQVMLPQFPADHLAELEAAAEHSGWPRDLLIFANTIPDLRKLTACSALIVTTDKSTTGGPLFGRNLDTTPFLPLHEYSFVAVYRPVGKRAFAVIAYPGTIGCYSGMNDAGLALADLTVNKVADGSLKFDPGGVPYTLAMRRVLEECDSLEQTEELIRSLRRTTMQNLAVCDSQTGEVLEISTKAVIPRRPEAGICACTNHFRTRELAGPGPLPPRERFDTLQQSQLADRLSIADVIAQLGAVHQGAATIQSMVFEPATLRLHLAIGPGPATSQPYRRIELRPLFSRAREAE